LDQTLYGQQDLTLSISITDDHQFVVMGEFYPAGSQNKKLLIFELNTTSDQYGLLQALPIEVPQLREVAIT